MITKTGVGVDIDITHIGNGADLTDRLNNQLRLGRRLAFTALSEADNGFRRLQVLQHNL
ncbi:hypothetical protein D3C73_1024560 [compost metagenome]